MRHVERRLVRLEAGRSESETPSPTGAETEPTKRRYVRPRTYPQLVTPEAEPDEDLVYGDATPVIVEWRRVRAEFLKTRATLDRTEVQEPMLEMEIALVGEHELTLPRPRSPGTSSTGGIRFGSGRRTSSGCGRSATGRCCGGGCAASSPSDCGGSRRGPVSATWELSRSEQFGRKGPDCPSGAFHSVGCSGDN